jgi:hypothetical protein
MQITIELIRTSERLPTQADGDAQGTVLTLHEYNGFDVEHYSNVDKYGRHIPAWAKLPDVKEVLGCLR